MTERDTHILVWQTLIAGDATALAELYRQHYTGLTNYARTVTTDKELVRDCLMDLLIGLWEKRASLPPVENVRSYLLTSLRREILHRLETDKRRAAKQAEAQLTLEEVQWSYEDYLVNLQSDESLQARLRAAMNKLTQRQKELLRLKFFEDLDYDAIAEQCGITKRTAYNIIYDAVKILKAELHTGRTSSFPFGLTILLILIAAQVPKTIF